MTISIEVKVPKDSKVDALVTTVWSDNKRKVRRFTSEIVIPGEPSSFSLWDDASLVIEEIPNDE